MTIRKPAAAGRFYPPDEASLKKLMDQMLAEAGPSTFSLRNQEVLGGIVPHGAYAYSGKTALCFFNSLLESGFVFDTAVIISPNHSGWGPGLALDDHSAWQTPLGLVKVDKDFFPLLDMEASAETHQLEHSTEVILPLLQYFFRKEFKILPIAMWDQSVSTAQGLALQLIKANKKLGKKMLVIASSDFSHYESPGFGRGKDDLALDQIAGFDLNGLAKVIKQNDISICGYGPIMTIMAMAKLIFEKPAFKISHRSNSGQAVASAEVVNYVSAVFYGQAN